MTIDRKQVDPDSPDALQIEQRPAMQTFQAQTRPLTRLTPFPANPGLWKGVNEEVKKPITRFNVGIVTVTEGRSPKQDRAFWLLRYIDPDTGHDVRRRVSGLDRDEIEAMAQNLTRRAYMGKGYLAGQVKAPELEAGIVQAVQLSRTRDYTKAGYLRRAKLFLAFMAVHYPSARTWGDMKPSMVEHYVRDCERRMLAFDTVRLRLAPIKATWRRMHEDWPEQVRPLPRIKQEAPPRREVKCLEPDEVAALLDWMRDNAQSLWPMACLQALAGLRMLEAAALRVQDVDLKAGTVTVTDTGHHKPKTRDSYRTIPVCAEVIEVLRVAITNQKIRPATGELFTNRRGNLWTVKVLSHRWGFILKRAAKTLDRTELSRLSAHKLRAAFATMASRLGVQDRLLKVHLGHSSGDVLGGHYRRVNIDELRLVSDLMDSWRSSEAWHKSVTIDKPVAVND